MNPRDFLECSKKLLDPPAGGAKPRPADCRTAISRSYYAALNVAKSLIDELKIILDKNVDSHREIMDLIAAGEDRLETACTLLASQKVARKAADYDMEEKSVETVLKASQIYIACELSIKYMDAVRSDPARWGAASAKIVNCARIRGKTFRP